MSPARVPAARDAPVLSPGVLVLLWPSGQAWCGCTSLEREMNPLMSTQPHLPAASLCAFINTVVLVRGFISPHLNGVSFASCLAVGAGTLAMPRPHTHSPRASRQRQSPSGCFPPTVLTSKKPHSDCKLQCSHTAGWSEHVEKLFFSLKPAHR